MGWIHGEGPREPSDYDLQRERDWAISLAQSQARAERLASLRAELDAWEAAQLEGGARRLGPDTALVWRVRRRKIWLHKREPLREYKPAGRHDEVPVRMVAAPDGTHPLAFVQGDRVVATTLEVLAGADGRSVGVEDLS